MFLSEQCCRYRGEQAGGDSRGLQLERARKVSSRIIFAKRKIGKRKKGAFGVQGLGDVGGGGGPRAISSSQKAQNS